MQQSNTSKIITELHDEYTYPETEYGNQLYIDNISSIRAMEICRAMVPNGKRSLSIKLNDVLNPTESFKISENEIKEIYTKIRNLIFIKICETKGKDFIEEETDIKIKYSLTLVDNKDGKQCTKQKFDILV